MVSNTGSSHYKRFEQLEASLRQQLDDYILQNKKILFVKTFRDHTGCSIHEALDVLTGRYDVLRQEKPDVFMQDHDDYWRHFYS